jgi:PleD family two-component response regulator
MAPRHARERRSALAYPDRYDYFKKYNDEYRHFAGDECLLLVATPSATWRSGQATSPHVSAARNSRCFFQHRRDRAKIIAERVRGAIIGLAIPHAVNPKQVVTISLGIATMRSSGVGKEQPDAAILATAADGALYEAKRAGRNRVHAAPPLVSVAAERDKAAAARSA